MADYAQIENPINILSATGKSSNSGTGTTATVGNWFRVYPHLGRLAFQVILQTSTVGATAGTTVFIEVSNSTAVASATKGQTLAPIATTDLVSEGAGLSSTMDRAWTYVRANLASLTTATAGSTGLGPIVNVLMSVGTIASV